MRWNPRCRDCILNSNHWNPKADIIYVSHAHMHHIPVIPENNLNNLEVHQNLVKFTCSKFRKDISIMLFINLATLWNDFSNRESEIDKASYEVYGKKEYFLVVKLSRALKVLLEKKYGKTQEQQKNLKVFSKMA